MEEKKWCARCKEEFPIAEKSTMIQMGFLFPLQSFNYHIKNHYQVKNEIGDYLCGNCYFDLSN